MSSVFGLGARLRRDAILKVGRVAFCLQGVGLRRVRVGKSMQYWRVGPRRLSMLAA